MHLTARLLIALLGLVVSVSWRSRLNIKTRICTAVRCASKADKAADQSSPPPRTANLKQHALDLLDCITSPVDENDPQYDIEKDMRRDNLLRANDYTLLKSMLRDKGLRTSGDKLQMITRLLLHEIDPSIKYEEL